MPLSSLGDRLSVGPPHMNLKITRATSAALIGPVFVKLSQGFVNQIHRHSAHRQPKGSYLTINRTVQGLRRLAHCHGVEEMPVMSQYPLQKAALTDDATE